MTVLHEPGEDAPLLLEGMRVLSFCHYLQGPAATQYLADLGADVIKVEPFKGAFERHWAGGESYVDGVSCFFLSANRNKRSIAVDLKQPESAEITRRLIERADVIVENYRPGVMGRLGLGYDQVRRIKSDIIYASATAFGADGPLKDRPGQDLLIQARSGLIATSGVVPTSVGCAAADQHGAALLAMGIAAAYARKLTTGRGTRVEGSLFAAGVDLQAEALTLYFSGKHDRRRLRRERHLATWYHPAPYGVYELADSVIAISLNSLERLVDSLGNEDLRPLATLPVYEARDRISAALAEELQRRTFDELTAVFDRFGIWYEQVHDYDDLAADPQAIHSRVFEDVPIRNGKATLVTHPLLYDGAKPRLRLRPPEIGEHTVEILKSLGFSTGEIEVLCTKRVIVNGTAAEEE